MWKWMRRKTKHRDVTGHNDANIFKAFDLAAQRKQLAKENADALEKASSVHRFRTYFQFLGR